LKILLFDWTAGGHHGTYVRRFSEVLSKHAKVTAAVPDETAETLNGCGAEIFPLGPARPLPDFARPLAPQNRELALNELEHFDRAVLLAKPDHALHLYADPVIRRIVSRPVYGAKVTLVLFWVRAHYPSLYATKLSLYELLRAWFLEYLAFRWRMRPDAHSVFVLDENVPWRWNRLRGAEVFWLPEPPVDIPQPDEADEATRSGCILYGALAPRKGIDLLARAVAHKPISLKVTLAGSVEPGFEHTLDGYCSQMREAGAEVELRGRAHLEQEGVKALAKAKCALLPYPRHYGMSRILLEAAHAGTPVIATREGLLGHLVKKYNLGSIADCRDAPALRATILDMCRVSVRDRYAASLKSFAGRYGSQCFERSITAPFRAAGGNA